MAGRTIAAALAAALALVACGGGDSGGAPAPLPAAERTVTDRAVVALKSNVQGLAALDETLVAIGENGPRRALVYTPGDGGASWRVEAPAGWALVDQALHPSGELSAVLAPADAAEGRAIVDTLRVWRLGRGGTLLHEHVFRDPAVADDPYHDLGGDTMPTSLQPRLSRDAVRLAPLGEDLALVLKSGQHAVLAYRLNWTAAGYARAWRTLVEPGSSVSWRFLTGGSFDVFGQLDNHVQLRIDTADDGTLGVGVVSAAGNAVFEAHVWHFGTPVAATYGVVFTRLAPDGRRLSASVLDTQQLAELHGLRALPGGWGLVGRVRTERRDDGSGWDAWAAVVDAQGQGSVRKVDVDRGEVLFDIAALPQGGGLVAVGSAGYTQNPGGASISEDAAPLLVRLNPDGTLLRRVAVAAGRRNNQLRAVVQHGGHWLLAGQRDGPGTHSGDADRALIRADGFVVAAPAL